MRHTSDIYTFTSPVRWNAHRDTQYAHNDDRFNNVLHVFDADWHGIRSACGCLPGHKLTISHKARLEGIELRYVLGLLDAHNIQHVLFQGYSDTAAHLATILRSELGNEIDIRVVTHVTSSQFEHAFELQMLRVIKEQISIGVLNGTGSVKPDFHYIFNDCWSKTLINMWPNVENRPPKRKTGVSGEVFVPLENTFRKNLFTNIIAAHKQPKVSRVFAVNEPSFLSEIGALTKLKRLAFQDRQGIFELCARSDVVMNATFAECQPMTELEAIAVGTPCLTGPLNIPELQNYEYTQVSTVWSIDNPHILGTALQKLLDVLESDIDAVFDMITEYREAVRRASLKSYLEFLEV